jgi:hypothetical protein
MLLVPPTKQILQVHTLVNIGERERLEAKCVTVAVYCLVGMSCIVLWVVSRCSLLLGRDAI